MILGKRIKALFKKLTKKQKKTFHGIAIGITVSMIVFLFTALGLTNQFELTSGDWRRKLFTSSTLSDKVVIVEITTESLKKGKKLKVGWPWPRDTYANMLSVLKKNGAKVAVFDFIFSEQSSYGVADDLAFITAISNFGPVIMVCKFDINKKFDKWKSYIKKLSPDEIKRKNSKEKMLADTLYKFSMPVKKEKDSIHINEMMHLSIPPYYEYLPVLTGVGDTQALLDKDGVVRNAGLLIKHQGRYFANLSLVTLKSILKFDKIILSKKSMKLSKKGKIIRNIPLNKDGNFPIKFYGPYRKLRRKKKIRTVDAFLLAMEYGNPGTLKKSGFDPTLLKDKIVIFGSTAPGLRDLRPNPFAKQDPGVFIYANMINNILQKDWIFPFENILITALLVLIFSLLTGLASTKLSIFKGIIVVIGLGVLFFLFSGIIFYLFNILIDVAAILLAVALSFIIGIIVNYILENQQKNFIQGAFSQLLAPAILHQLIENPDLLQLGGESKELTIFFSDIQGFTTLSEALGTPEKLVEILNEYLTAMTEIILKYDGYVDKYEGDAIMAFWGAPIDDTEHAWKGCWAALDNQVKMKEMKEKFQAMGLLGGELKVRIGLNTGDAVVGMMGSIQKLNYTTIGDPVNLASRLEGANKQYSTLIMISEATRIQAANKIETRPLDLIRVKGKNLPTEVHELVAKKGEANPKQLELIQLFSAGIEYYRKMDFATALAEFGKIKAIFPEDGPTKVYTNRCKEFIVNPPAEPWDGVFTMKTK